MVLLFSQVRVYAQVSVLGRFWYTLGSQVWWRGQLRFTPRFRNFPLFKLKVVRGSRSRGRRRRTARHRRRRAAADRVELPGLELERGELVVVLVGERGVEVRIVRRRAVVDRHEVGEVGRGEKRLVNRDLAQARLIRARCYTMCPGPGGAASQVLIQSVRSGKFET